MKSILLTFAVILTAALLVACDKKEEEKPTTTTPVVDSQAQPVKAESGAVVTTEATASAPVFVANGPAKAEEKKEEVKK